MAGPTFTMRQLLEAGVHFGHQTKRWNPKMEPYLFGVRNGVHIIDLQQTVPLLYRALAFVQEVVGGGGRVLFVATKRQATQPIAEYAQRCGQYYVNHRWLGGMLTNWRTISQSIARLKMLDEQLNQENLGLTKKETLNLTRERDKLERALGGIRDMGGIPDVVFIIDTNKESIAKSEAVKLGIPVIAVIDSNCDPDGINYPIPGNDDATRAINLYCDLVSQAVLSGLQAEAQAAGTDLGDAEEAPAEDLAAIASTEAEAAGAPAATEGATSEAATIEAATAEAATTEAATTEAATTEGAATEASGEAGTDAAAPTPEPATDQPAKEEAKQPDAEAAPEQGEDKKEKDAATG